MIVHERISRIDQGLLREQLLQALRNLVDRHGGTWVRLARYPYPYRSAFNFRADLDEPYPRDFRRFAHDSQAIADCTTLFVSTRAYGRDMAILRELADYDAQSHGHDHVVYRDEEMNLRNLRQAHDILDAHGLTPTAFAAPEGRWNEGLDRVIESFGYEYSSDFQLSFDDLPFFPWRDGRFSRVLQVPIHPICEGLFLDAGALDLGEFSGYLRRTARAKIDAGEPVFLYGHPERRLGRHPKPLDALIQEVAREPLLWRVTLTAFARWWRWRSLRKWSLRARGPGLLEVQFEDGDAAYPLALEVLRGEHVASIPIRTARTTFRSDQLAFEKRRPPSDRLQVVRTVPDGGFKQVVKQMLDWETVTPIEELPSRTLRDQLKRKLRRWRSRTGQNLAESVG
jgi:peptidoglycan/xylan/chitin deacetylase (PgdA/CDA1 family)